MAKAKKNTASVGSFTYVHKLGAAVALLAFVVIAIQGFRIQAPINQKILSITWSAFLVMVGVKVVVRVVVQIFKSYEEMNRGQT